MFIAFLHPLKFSLGAGCFSMELAWNKMRQQLRNGHLQRPIVAYRTVAVGITGCEQLEYHQLDFIVNRRN